MTLTEFINLIENWKQQGKVKEAYCRSCNKNVPGMTFRYMVKYAKEKLEFEIFEMTCDEHDMRFSV